MRRLQLRRSAMMHAAMEVHREPFRARGMRRPYWWRDARVIEAECPAEGSSAEERTGDRDSRTGADTAGGDGAPTRSPDVRPAAARAGVLQRYGKHGVDRRGAAGAGESGTGNHGARYDACNHGARGSSADRRAAGSAPGLDA